MGDPLKTTISYLNSDLSGSGYIANKEYKFSYVLPEDVVDFIPLGRGKKRFNKILSNSTQIFNNVKCSYFKLCGGCKAQHIIYPEQFNLKTKPIVQFYKDKFDLEMETFPAIKEYHYRNRMDFAVFPEAIGLRQQGNFRKIIDIENCLIQKEIANQELQRIRPLIDQKIIYNRKSETGYLKYLTIRTNSSEKEMMSIFTFTEDFQESSLELTFESLILEKSLADNIIFCYNRKKSEVSAVGKHKVIKGKDYYCEEFNGETYEIPFDGFFQPNPEGFLPIIEFIEESISNNRNSTLIDLFCGTGFFSLQFGSKFVNLIGYDIVESSIIKANQLVKKKFPNKNISFAVKDLLSLEKNLSEEIENEKESIILLDPPRNGVGEKLAKSISKCNVKNILYVSCNPQSQISDLEIISNSFKPIKARITDPYPHTPHLESVILLERIHE
jgi:23S rRNA (uracil-5-)-methyltransferase RumA